MSSSISSFALYRLPEEKEPILIEQNLGKTSTFESLAELNKKSGFIFAPFNPTKQSPILLIRADKIKKGWGAVEELSKDFCKIVKPKANDTVSVDVIEPHSYIEAFGKFLKALEMGKFEKLVLSRKACYPLPKKFSPISAFKKACEKYPNMMVSLCYSEEAGLWLGSTPEILLEGDKSQWHTVALAGTMAKTGQIHWSEKNKKEQEIVSNYIQDIIGKYGSEIEVKGPYTSEAGHLVHLKTDIVFNLKDQTSIGDILEQLHPTPAICGMPKAQAKDFILRNEGYDRSYYSGIIGPISYEDKTRLFVNLRCSQITDNEMILYAGGGLLPSSEFESEWEETQIKMNTMRNIY